MRKVVIFHYFIIGVFVSLPICVCVHVKDVAIQMGFVRFDLADRAGGELVCWK